MYLVIYMLIMILILMMIVIVLLNLVSKKHFQMKKKFLLLNVDLILKQDLDYLFLCSFFLIAIIFFIFDVEIALNMPMIKVMSNLNFLTMMMTTILFLLILVGGLFHEWNQGALKWMK